MTTGERLTQLSGLSGVTAAVMLLAIGSGATTGAALVNYSGLPTGTAAQHLLVDFVDDERRGRRNHRNRMEREMRMQIKQQNETIIRLATIIVTTGILK